MQDEQFNWWIGCSKTKAPSGELPVLFIIDFLTKIAKSTYKYVAIN